MSGSIRDLAIEETPIAVIDFETTGFSPKSGDRVLEVSVVRCDPGQPPRLVLDTLVDPMQEVRGTYVHGITDDDVLGAPLFSELMGPIAHAITGAVVACYNASFDLSFLAAETRRARRLAGPESAPHLCMMYMRPALGIGSRTALCQALADAQLPPSDHRAAHDALATGHLWNAYTTYAIGSAMRTFGEIEAAARFKFARSWDATLFDEAMAYQIGPPETTTALKPRPRPPTYPPGAPRSSVPQDPERAERTRHRLEYHHALIDALLDDVLSEAELAQLKAIQASTQITKGEVRAIHAAVYGSVARQCAEDHFVSHEDAAKLVALAAALRQLGWAPGDESMISARA